MTRILIARTRRLDYRRYIRLKQARADDCPRMSHATALSARDLKEERREIEIEIVGMEVITCPGAFSRLSC